MSKSLNRPETVLSGKGIASIAKNAVYLLGVNVLNRVVRFLYVIALARYLGPELYGLINYGISWYLTFLSLSCLGMAVILSREIGRDKSRGAWIGSLTLTLRSSAAIIAAIACAILGWLLESKPEVKTLLIVFSIGLVGRSLAKWAENVFTAYEVSKYAFRIQAIFRTFEVFVGTAFLLAGGGAMAVVIVHAISWWLQGLCGLVLTRRKLVQLWFNWSWHGVRQLLVEGSALGLGGSMARWLQMGPLVLFRYVSPSENSLAQFALAMQALIILRSVPLAISMASLPILRTSVTRQDRKEILFAETMIRATFVFGGVVGLAGLMAGPWFVQVLFGTR
jgi:O-antigen/teichoic acid export membrane protein